MKIRFFSVIRPPSNFSENSFLGVVSRAEYEAGIILLEHAYIYHENIKMSGLLTNWKIFIWNSHVGDGAAAHGFFMRPCRKRTGVAGLFLALRLRHQLKISLDAEKSTGITANTVPNRFLGFFWKKTFEKVIFNHGGIWVKIFGIFLTGSRINCISYYQLILHIVPNLICNFLQFSTLVFEAPSYCIQLQFVLVL